VFLTAYLNCRTSKAVRCLHVAVGYLSARASGIAARATIRYEVATDPGHLELSVEQARHHGDR